MFTSLLDWIKPMITGFASAWSWLVTPIYYFPSNDLRIGAGGSWVTIPEWSVSPISVISFGGLAILFLFGLAKTVWDALPVV